MGASGEEAHTRSYAHTHSHTLMCTHSCEHTLTPTHVHTNSHLHAHTHAHMQIHSCTHTLSCTHTYTHAHACMHTHTHIHLCAHTHAHTLMCAHTHIHISCACAHTHCLRAVSLLWIDPLSDRLTLRGQAGLSLALSKQHTSTLVSGLGLGTDATPTLSPRAQKPLNLALLCQHSHPGSSCWR